MKKIMKLKKIHVKSKSYTRRLRNKNNFKNISFRKKYIYQQIESPHNTSDFLISNQSSPFFDYDEEDTIFVYPSKLIKFDDDTSSELDIFNFNGLNSTKDESVILNEKLELGKEQKEECLDDIKK